MKLFIILRNHRVIYKPTVIQNHPPSNHHNCIQHETARMLNYLSIEPPEQVLTA